MYLAHHVADPHVRFAVKIYKRSYLRVNKDHKLSITNEITAMDRLDHFGVIGVHDFGSNGMLKRPDGKFNTNVHFCVMDYAEGICLFDLCEGCGALGEDAGRYLIR